VTVCIAAICPSVDRIILVSDGLVSNEWTSTEGSPKFHSIGHRWVIMVATHNLWQFPALMRRVETILGPRLSPEAITESCEQAYAEELEKHINQTILLPLGVTRDGVVEHGLTWFGEQYHAALLAEIRAATLGTELLIAGFDDGGGSHLFTLQNGAISDLTEARYAAIGSGAYNARGVLDPIANFVYGDDLSELLYRMLAAKFAAESTPTVGSVTFLQVISPTESWQFMVNSTIDQVREIWRHEGQPPVPAAAADILGSPNALFPRPTAET